MALRFLTEDLVDSVKRRSLVPVSQTTFQDSDIIALANEEMGITIVPDIQAVREDLFLASKDVTVVGGTTDYKLPERAIGSALKSLLYGTNSDSLWELPKIHLTRTMDSITSGQPDSFFLKGDSVSLSPTPSGSGLLQMWYYMRPSEIVPTSETSLITAVSNDGTNVTLTVGTDLTGILSTTLDADIYNAKSPAVIKAIDVSIGSITSSTIVVPTVDVLIDGVLQVEVGDSIALAKTANTLFVPVEFHPVLAQAVSCRLLEALGDLNKLQSGIGKLGEMRSQALKLIANRVETAVEFFNNPYGFSNQTGRASRRSAPR